MAVAPLRAALLRHKIKIYQPVETPIDGGSSTSWQLVDSPWADVQGFTNRRGGEEVSADALQSVSFFRIVIRYRAALDGALTMQLLHGDKVLNVTSAYDPDGRREQLWLTADTLGVRDMGL